uniref:Envelope glycoprotein gH n=1 Tax=Macaca mulatta rhadinovirus TaxID=703611 RepID=D2XTD9_9GAMA|nr:envelope glycoprotein gH [Macaca mulatta rhadinovirus]ADB27129.1 envelope glycoprotein gH [Macaca mulatta rhadinovirus]
MARISFIFFFTIIRCSVTDKYVYDEKSNVELEFNGTIYQINWRNVSKELTSIVMEDAWYDSLLLEPLSVTLEKRKSLLRSSIVNVHNNDYTFCKSSSDHVINLTVDFNYSSLPGFTGNFNVMTHGLTQGVLLTKRELFTDSTNIMDLFYAEKINAEMFKITFDYSNVIISGIITENWILVSVTNSSVKSNMQCVALLFGVPSTFPALKGYVSYRDLLVVKNSNYALGVIAPKSYNTLDLAFLPKNFTEMFVSVINSPLNAIDYLKGKLLAIEAKGACQNPSNENDILSFFFEVTAVNFLFIKNLQKQQLVNVGCVVRHVAALESLMHLLRLCYPTFKLYELNLETLSHIAESQVFNLPANSMLSLSVNDQEVVFSMFKIVYNTPKVSGKILNEIVYITNYMYTKYSENYQLTNTFRRNVMNMYEVLTTIKLNVTDSSVFYPYILFTSMCNNVEISYMINQIAKPDDITIFRVFSPCFLSLRFDLDENKLRSDAPQTSKRTGLELAQGASGFWRLLHAFHATRINEFSVINCTRLAWKQVTALMPLTNITYVISSVRPDHARVYEVSEVFLNSAMFVSAVYPNCSHFTPPGTALHIPILYNFSAPRIGCPLCDSIVLSYDENQGLQTMMYVSNPTVQANLFSPYSPFFDNDNFHIHYLWLMNNGTVVEIRGLYRRHALSAIALVFAFIGTMSALYFLFKLFSILA